MTTSTCIKLIILIHIQRTMMKRRTVWLCPPICTITGSSKTGCCVSRVLIFRSFRVLHAVRLIRERVRTRSPYPRAPSAIHAWLNTAGLSTHPPMARHYETFGETGCSWIGCRANQYPPKSRFEFTTRSR